MSTDNSGKVHMALDDIIKQGKMERRGENKNRSRFGKLDQRRIGDNGIRRRSDKDENRQMSSTRLSITNLHRDIVNSELRKIFSDCGKLMRCGIHWDELGFSKGTADVEYENAEDAKKAVDKFDNAEVEGQAMRVQFAESKSGKRKILSRVRRRRNIPTRGRREIVVRSRGDRNSFSNGIRKRYRGSRGNGGRRGNNKY